jgi:hypothetical protein
VTSHGALTEYKATNCKDMSDVQRKQRQELIVSKCVWVKLILCAGELIFYMIVSFIFSLIFSKGKFI